MSAEAMQKMKEAYKAAHFLKTRAKQFIPSTLRKWIDAWKIRHKSYSLGGCVSEAWIKARSVLPDFWDDVLHEVMYQVRREGDNIVIKIRRRIMEDDGTPIADFGDWEEFVIDGDGVDLPDNGLSGIFTAGVGA